MVGAGEPALEERAGGGEREEGGSDEDAQGLEEPELGGPGWHAQVDRDEERSARCQKKDGVDGALDLEGGACREEVGVAVAGEEQGLEEHHAGVPDAGAAAQEREEDLAAHGLGDEEECRGEEDG